MGKLKRCEILIMVIIIITLVYGCSNENRRKENNADVLLEEVENLVEQSSQLFQMIKALTGLILETVEESGVHAADSLRIICGDYMDHAVVLYAHGHPEEACQQKLTGARRASRGR